MAHFMDGDWRSFVSRDGNAADDKLFHLEIDPASGILTANSRHDGTLITGQVIRGGHFHHVFFNKGTARAYRGILVMNGPTMMLCGHVILNSVGVAAGASSMSEDEVMSLFQQVNEVWIATKP
jgi:hypothetical protein